MTSPPPQPPSPIPPTPSPPSPNPTEPGVLSVIPLSGIPQVGAGDDLAALILAALTDSGIGLLDGDVLVVSSKVASKALGLAVDAAEDGKDELVRSQARRVVAERLLTSGRPTRVVEALAGPVMAAAGIDASNTGSHGRYLLLPHDPDQVCRDLHDRIGAGLRPATVRFGVLLSDTSSRPWRLGVGDFALGAWGVRVLDDLRGSPDADGRVLEVTTRALGDELCSAADLVKGKATGIPAALIRGLPAAVVDPGEHSATSGRDLVRTGADDWFGHGRVEAVRAALGAEPGSAAATAVGIPRIGTDEPVADRLARAVRLATLGCPDAQVRIRRPGPRDWELVVTGEDPYAAGHHVARLEVALWPERLRARRIRRLDDRVVIDVGVVPES